MTDHISARIFRLEVRLAGHTFSQSAEQSARIDLCITDEEAHINTLQQAINAASILTVSGRLTKLQLVDSSGQIVWKCGSNRWNIF